MVFTMNNHGSKGFLAKKKKGDLAAEIGAMTTTPTDNGNKGILILLQPPHQQFHHRHHQSDYYDDYSQSRRVHPPPSGQSQPQRQQRYTSSFLTPISIENKKPEKKKGGEKSEKIFEATVQKNPLKIDRQIVTSSTCTLTLKEIPIEMQVENVSEMEEEIVDTIDFQLCLLGPKGCEEVGSSQLSHVQEDVVAVSQGNGNSYSPATPPSVEVRHVDYEKSSIAEDHLTSRAFYFCFPFRVLRGGQWPERDVTILVPGGIFSIKLGGNIPTGVRLHERDHLRIDQSAFTGESFPVTKRTTNEVSCGSICRQEEIEAIVITKGVYSFIGKAVHLVDSTEFVGHFQKALTNKFSLGREILEIFAVMGFQRLPFSNRVFDNVHYTQCRAPWHAIDGALFLESNLVLHPGSFFVWSVTPAGATPTKFGMPIVYNSLLQWHSFETVKTKSSDEAKKHFSDGIHFMEDHHVPSFLPNVYLLSKPRVPFQRRKKLDLAIYNFEDCEELKEPREAPRVPGHGSFSIHGYWIPDVRFNNNFLFVVDPYSNPVEYNSCVVCLGKVGRLGVYNPTEDTWYVLDKPEQLGVPCEECYLGYPVKSAYNERREGYMLFDPGGASLGRFISLGIYFSHSVLSIDHGPVLFDPGGICMRNLNISLSCQRRVGEQRMWDHTFPQAEFMKDSLNSRRVRFEEGWTDAGAKRSSNEIKHSRVSRSKRIVHVGRISPQQANSSETGLIGMSLSYGLSLNMFLVLSIQNQCTLSNDIISVERLNQYMHVPSEAPEVIEDQLKEKHIRGYRQLEKHKMNKTLDEYLALCSHAKVKAETLVIEMDDIGKGIIELITQHAITKLVMGAAADRQYSKRMKALKTKFQLL